MKSKHLLLLTAAVVSFLIPMLRAQQRFDHLVRNDFFSGFAGNREAFDRAMKLSEEVLKTEPNHPEALVWHGAGLFFQSNAFFQKGDQATGMEYYGRGVGEMKKAVAIAPNEVAVRAPRGAALLSASRSMPPQMAKALREDGIADYLVIYNKQKDNLDQVGAHPKGELLFGLADAYSRTGELDKAQQYFDLITEKLPGSVYAKRAAKWNETKQPLTAAEATCSGCHTGGK